MLEPGAHWDYVLAAYGAGAVILAALIGWSVAGARRARRVLDELETRVSPHARGRAGEKR